MTPQQPQNDDRLHAARTIDLMHHAESRAGSEPELRAFVAEVLRERGLKIKEHVACAAGMADLVTAERDLIIEVKLELTRQQIYSAIGQVLLYRQAIEPAAKAVVIGYSTPDSATLLPYAAAIGVEIVAWTYESDQPSADAGKRLRRSHLSPPPVMLQWRVQALAQERGIETVSHLGRVLDIPRASLYGIWRGTAQSVSVEMLERLLVGLETTGGHLKAGDWFLRRQDNHLHWNIPAVAERVGIDKATFGFDAELLPRMSTNLWFGTAQSVSLITLGRIAQALDSDDQPFDVGDLFRRMDPDS